jgi:putative transposase
MVFLRREILIPYEDGSAIMRSMVRFISDRRLAGLFPPKDPEKEQLLQRLRQPPCHPDPDITFSSPHWTLALLHWLFPVFSFFLSSSSVSKRLKQYGISRKKGRLHLESPDPEGEEKRQKLEAALNEVRNSPGTKVFLYEDEKTVYRQPPLGYRYGERGRGGKRQPTAFYRGGANTKLRIAGALNVLTGEVSTWLSSTIGVKELCKFLRKVRERYREAEVIYMGLDNWYNVHKNPELLRVAQEVNIRLLYLPTYSPWMNPIEKLWNKLGKEILTLHPWSSQWSQLKEAVKKFLGNYARPSPDLLRYVGLAGGD